MRKRRLDDLEDPPQRTIPSARTLRDLQKIDRVRIGISGWTYAPWRGKFYPQKLPHNKELSYAANQFSTIEVNGTFYSLQRPESFRKWAQAVPEDFVFAIKGSRFITHIRRLKNVRVALANFLASGLLRLGPKLGPILWQLPPWTKFDPKRLESFLKILPQDTGEAVTLARRHNKVLSGRSWMKVDAARPLSHCLEIRNETFRTREFVDLLQHYNIGLVCADSVEWPRIMDVTSDVVYCRLHGSEELYSSGYTDEALQEWASRVTAWARGSEPQDAERIVNRPGPKRASRSVFVYFDNDAKVRAPVDARKLIELVAQPAKKHS